MNTFTTVRDGTSMSTDEWNEVLAREELFIAGMADLFGLKELKRPLSEEARRPSSAACARLTIRVIRTAETIR